MTNYCNRMLKDKILKKKIVCWSINIYFVINVSTDCEVYYFLSNICIYPCMKVRKGAMELKCCLVWAGHYIFSIDETYHFVILTTLNTVVLNWYRFHMCNNVHETTKPLSMPRTTTNFSKIITFVDPSHKMRADEAI